MWSVRVVFLVVVVRIHMMGDQSSACLEVPGFSMNVMFIDIVIDILQDVLYNDCIFIGYFNNSPNGYGMV